MNRLVRYSTVLEINRDKKSLRIGRCRDPNRSKIDLWIGGFRVKCFVTFWTTREKPKNESKTLRVTIGIAVKAMYSGILLIVIN